MKTSDLFPRKTRAKAVSDFTPEQAAANLELLQQQLEESGLTQAAVEYFSDFTVTNNKGIQRRCWLLPGGHEGIADLKDAQVDHVLKNWSYYRAQIEKVKQSQADDVPWL